MLERHISLGCHPRPPTRPPTRPRTRSVEQRDSSTLFFEYENEDEKQSNRHIRHLPIESLPSTSSAGATFSDRSLGKSLASFSMNIGLPKGGLDS